jgi:DNA-binding response OmpR family regulator
MILVISQDDQERSCLLRAVQDAGSRALGCEGLAGALEVARAEEPEVVVCATAAGDNSAAKLAEAYREALPEHRSLVLLVADAEQLPQALAEQADDFLLRPIAPQAAAARIRILRRRSRTGIRARFRGDIRAMPLVEVLRFCERSALTGQVRFDTTAGMVVVRFRAGQIETETGDPSDQLAELMSLDSGTFIIESEPTEFREIETARRTSLPPRRAAALPIGRQSAVRVGTRQFHIHTDYQPPPASCLVTVAAVGDQVVKRQETPVSVGPMQELWARLDMQHFAMEQAVRGTIDRFFRAEDDMFPGAGAGQVTRPHGLEGGVERQTATQHPESAFAGPADSEAHREADRGELLDLALRKWRGRDLDAALVLLEAAGALEPGDRAVQACLRAVRRSLRR